MSFGRSFDDRLTLREAMSRLMEESYVPGSRGQSRGGEQAQTVPVNLFEAGDNVTLFAPMPGLQPEDVEISVANGVLTIYGAKRGPGEERRNFYVHEWTVGPYHRAIQLPEDLDYDTARASLDNGVLVVTFDKSERTKPRRIQIQSAGS